MKNSSNLAIWNLVIVASVIVTVATFAYHTLTPMPSFALSKRAQAEQVERARLATYAAREAGEKAKADAARRLWKEDPEKVGPAALEIVNQLARKRNLKVSSFRPQKPVDEAGLMRLPYLVSLEGTYRDALAFVKEVGQPENRLAVNLIQFASADGESSSVRATVGLWAMREGTKAAATRPGGATRTRSTQAVRRS